MGASIVLQMPAAAPFPQKALPGRLVRVDEWSTAVGGEVYIARAGHVVRVGMLEMVSADESFAWVSQSGAEARQLFSRIDGHELWIAPLHLQQRTSKERSS